MREGEEDEERLGGEEDKTVKIFSRRARWRARATSSLFALLSLLLALQPASWAAALPQGIRSFLRSCFAVFMTCRPLRAV